MPPQQLSASTMGQLQKLISVCGEVLLHFVPSADSALITLEEVKAETPLDINIPAYFVTKLMSIKNGKWASCLFQVFIF